MPKVRRGSALQIQERARRVRDQIEFDAAIERDRQLFAVDAPLDNTVHVECLSERDQGLRLRFGSKCAAGMGRPRVVRRRHDYSRPARGRRRDLIHDSQSGELSSPDMAKNQSDDWLGRNGGDATHVHTYCQSREVEVNRKEVCSIVCKHRAREQGSPRLLAVNIFTDRDLRDLARLDMSSRAIGGVECSPRPCCKSATDAELRPVIGGLTAKAGCRAKSAAIQISILRKAVRPMRIGMSVAATPISSDSKVPNSKAASQVPAHGLSRQARKKWQGSAVSKTTSRM
jgi:hypothetical protein